jgi:2-amino-4-hydroxy-6-hydroxymethyldihydropteridine diphosphokinase
MNLGIKTPRPANRSHTKIAFLSLGSNLGDRADSIRQALARLRQTGVKVRRVSSRYETEPVDHRAQPWFLNCVAEVETKLSPRQLLSACKSIERALGRRPSLPKGPRAIDIDILFYENVVVDSARLRIPHARLGERRFVLAPLCELRPEIRHPVSGRTAAEMLAEIRDTAQVIRLGPQTTMARRAKRTDACPHGNSRSRTKGSRIGRRD